MSTDLTAAGAPRGLVDRFLLSATVAEVRELTPRLRAIRLAGPALRGLSWRPGNHVRVLVGELLSVRGFRDALRTYSIRDADPDGGLELCVFAQPQDGPGARWAAAARPGLRVRMTRPEGRMTVRADAPYHLFVGDETAVAPFGAMIGALPAGTQVRGLLAAGVREDAGTLPELDWVEPGGPGLAAAVAGLRLPDQPGVAYVAGEAEACRDVRRHLVRERGWPRDRVVVKAFWAPGRRGLD